MTSRRCEVWWWVVSNSQTTTDRVLGTIIIIIEMRCPGGERPVDGKERVNGHITGHCFAWLGRRQTESRSSAVLFPFERWTVKGLVQRLCWWGGNERHMSCLPVCLSLHHWYVAGSFVLSPSLCPLSHWVAFRSCRCFCCCVSILAIDFPFTWTRATCSQVGVKIQGSLSESCPAVQWVVVSGDSYLLRTTMRVFVEVMLLCY